MTQMARSSLALGIDTVSSVGSLRTQVGYGKNKDIEITLENTYYTYCIEERTKYFQVTNM